MASLFIYLAIMVGSAIIAGLLGFWLSRRHYLGELAWQERAWVAELSRMRRHVTTAESRAARIKAEAEKLRRRLR